MAPRMLCAATFFLVALPLELAAQEPSLVKLRQDLAMRYVEPEPHMALARHYHKRGDRLQAFFILEYGRRNLFPASQFDRAFQQAFLDDEPFDNSPQAEAALLKKLAENPKAAKIAVKVADVYISRQEWPQAKKYLTQAIELAPTEFEYVSALAKVLEREDKEEESEKLIDGFVRRYPESREAYTQRIYPLIRSDPAQARKLLDEARKKFPKEGGFLFNLGVLLQDEGKLAEAEDHFVRAAALSDHPHIHGWLGRFYLKAKKAPEEAKALEYYLNAYFLDPHFHDSEHAEQRIRKLSSALGSAQFEASIAAGKELVDLLGDKNRVVIGLALDGMKEIWNPTFVPPLLEALSHDDEMVRYRAMHLLLARVDRSFDKDLKSLLADPDLRRRGIGGYLAVKVWGHQGIDAVKPWLKEESQLLRYDAVSALLEFGGSAGHTVVKDHHPGEKNPWLKSWIQQILAADEKKK